MALAHRGVGRLGQSIPEMRIIFIVVQALLESVSLWVG